MFQTILQKTTRENTASPCTTNYLPDKKNSKKLPENIRKEKGTMFRPNCNGQLYNIQGKTFPLKSYRLMFIIWINNAAKL